MDKDSLEMIENEISIFIRRIVISEKRNSSLERSAYVLLRQLSSKGPSGVKALAEGLELDVSTISRQAAALEQKKYVDKIPNPHDGRGYFYRITVLGKKELDENKQRRYKNLSHMLKEWSETELHSFGHLLQKYNQAINEQTDK